MVIFDKNFSEIFSFQIVSIIGGLITGTVLALYTNKLLIIPGMLILLPGFLEMRGNISGSLAARLSSGLFLGVVKKKHSKVVRGNLIASFLLAVITGLALGLIAFLFDLFIFEIYVSEIIFVPLIASVIASSVEIPVTLFSTFYWFKKGHDPNNIMGPFITAMGDVVSTISLLITMVIIL